VTGDEAKGRFRDARAAGVEHRELPGRQRLNSQEAGIPSILD
jgi:hypothetical protein